MNNLGKFIQKKLKELKLSEREMAKRCKISHSYLNQLIKGHNPKTKKPISPTIQTLFKLSAGFRIPVDFLQKVATGTSESYNTKKSMPTKEFIHNMEINSTNEGVIIGGALDRTIPWEEWNQIKESMYFFKSVGLDPSEYSKEDWQTLVKDISLVIRLHKEKKI